MSARGRAARPGGSRGPVRDRVVELVRVRAADLLENPSNWRTHPGHQRSALRGVLKEIGYSDALIARRTGDGLELIDGHLRRSLDPEQVVPVLVVDLDEREAEVLLATLDPLAALAVADSGALAELLSRVQTGSSAVQDLLDSLAKQAGLPVRPLLADPEDIPPVPVTPSTSPGDLYLLGDHRLLCGDATKARDLQRLMGTERASCLLTDPPYGVSYVGKTPRRLRIDRDDRVGIEDLIARSFAAIDEVLEPGARLYLFHPAGEASVVFGERFLAQGWLLRQSLVWAKDRMVLGHSDYHYRHEPILYGFKPGPGRWGRGHRGWYGGNAADTVVEVPRPAASRDHPTAKPVALLRRLLANSTKEADAVLDPFAGSGSTLVAAEVSGRRGFGVEIDPAYCDVAVSRWERVTGERAIRERAGRRTG